MKPSFSLHTEIESGILPRVMQRLLDELLKTMGVFLWQSSVDSGNPDRISLNSDRVNSARSGRDNPTEKTE